MKQLTPQQQLWKALRTDEQRAAFARHFHHIKHRTQADLCLGILAYIRWGIIRDYENPWINSYFRLIIKYLETEKEYGNL